MDSVGALAGTLFKTWREKKRYTTLLSEAVKLLMKGWDMFKTGTASLGLHHTEHICQRVHYTVLSIITYRWRPNLADSWLLCYWTNLGNVAQRILKFLPWWLEYWTLWRRYKLFPFHCPESSNRDKTSESTMWSRQQDCSTPESQWNFELN